MGELIIRCSPKQKTQESLPDVDNFVGNSYAYRTRPGGVILIQRSEGGGLGIGGGTAGGFMTARGTTNLLTRTTAILAFFFICTSIGLTVIATRSSKNTDTLLQPVPPLTAPESGANDTPTPNVPAAPTVPFNTGGTTGGNAGNLVPSVPVIPTIPSVPTPSGQTK